MMQPKKLPALLQEARNGDPQAKRILVEENLGLVWSVVRRFLNRGVEREDLFQLACIGLLKAIDKFDASYEVQFSTYAVPLMIGEIRRFLRDDGTIKVARSIKELAGKLYHARETLYQELHQEPSVQQLAEYLQVSCEDVCQAIDAYQGVASLQQSVLWSDGNEVTLEDRIEEEKNETEAAENRLLIQQLILKLPKAEQRVIILRYYFDKTQSQVAQALGMTQVQVSRTERKILRKMRQELVEPHSRK